MVESHKMLSNDLIPDASFSENFYGLKRRRRPYIETPRATAAVGGIPSGEPLRSPEIWRSLLFLVCNAISTITHALIRSFRLESHMSEQRHRITLRNLAEGLVQMF